MTHEERMRYRKAINVIDYKIIGRPHVVEEPTIEQGNAIVVAAEALERQMKATHIPSLSRHINVLCYHIARPTALLFKDRITLDALTAGILAIKWLIERDNEEKEAET